MRMSTEPGPPTATLLRREALDGFDSVSTERRLDDDDNTVGLLLLQLGIMFALFAADGDAEAVAVSAAATAGPSSTCGGVVIMVVVVVGNAAPSPPRCRLLSTMPSMCSSSHEPNSPDTSAFSSLSATTRRPLQLASSLSVASRARRRCCCCKCAVAAAAAAAA